ncbi:hypothetical protein LIPSTDRAFT_67561 [Lipomyces starkeyi NRRL Y-11557]|uniref:Uncharacterized protein n=1 Tax=Lipomyces starkeyi NRRL Y-11557 TaxID=675824 RepID=A0A1E3QHP0_LIPST|nr:hypothetical protein LIPSTDRAFT_67561 [Lipomyces starkeyi NRRL Y-11557]
MRELPRTATSAVCSAAHDSHIRLERAQKRQIGQRATASTEKTHQPYPYPESGSGRAKPIRSD